MPRGLRSDEQSALIQSRTVCTITSVPVIQSLWFNTSARQVIAALNVAGYTDSYTLWKKTNPFQSKPVSE